jgi:hypothetical protein
MSIKKTLATAKELGITLKKLKTFPGHDGMEGFDADIYVNGKPALHVYDSAHGGCFEYSPIGTDYKAARSVEAELEEKLKAFPEHEVEMGGGRTYMSRDTLDCVIGALVSEAGFQKDMKRDSKKGILIEVPNGYSIIKFKAGTITTMLKKHPQEAVAMMLQGVVKRELKAGKTILNLEYLKALGVKA